MWEVWTDYLGLTALFYIWVCKYTMIFNSSNAYDKRFVPPRFKIFHWLTTSGTKSVGKKGVLVTGLGYLVELMLFIGNNYEAFNVFPRAADLLIYTIWISYAAWVPGGLFVLIAYLLGSVLVIVQLVCHLFHAARGQRIFIDKSNRRLCCEVHGLMFAQTKEYGSDPEVNSDYMHKLGESEIFAPLDKYDDDVLRFLKVFMQNTSKHANPVCEKYKDCWYIAYRWRKQCVKHAKIFKIGELEFYRMMYALFVKAGVEEWLKSVKERTPCDEDEYLIDLCELVKDIKEFMTEGRNPLISTEEGILKSFTLYFTTTQPYQFRETPKPNVYHGTKSSIVKLKPRTIKTKFQEESKDKTQSN